VAGTQFAEDLDSVTNAILQSLEGSLSGGGFGGVSQTTVPTLEADEVGCARGHQLAQPRFRFKPDNLQVEVIGFPRVAELEKLQGERLGVERRE
jgi:hypothetical protein